MDVRGFFGAQARKPKTLIKGRKTIKVAVRKPSALVKVVRKVASAVVDRKIETKYCTTVAENNVAHNSGIAAGDCYRVCPEVRSTPVTSGSSYGRIGDKIAPTGLYVRGQVGLVTPSTSNKPIMVRILVLQLKGQHYWPSAQSAWTSGAYAALLKRNDEGGVENVTFGGLSQDLYTPVNKDVFEVLGERYIKLQGHVDGSVESSPRNALAKNFNMKIKTPAKLTYGATANIYPENFAPFVSIGYAYMDGTAPDTIQTPLIASVYGNLYYKDM